VAFSTGVTPFADRLQPALSASEAARWVDSLVAQGGTNIDLALLTAMGLANQERPAILIFLTDGLATEGVTGTEQILADVQRAAPGNVRLFDFGVGDDVDTILLDTLAEQNHGASAYVRPGQDIDEAVSGFYARVSTPVLSDVKLDFGGAEAFDLYPNPLPDLFAGSQLVLAGRYQNPGPGAVSLAGTVNGRPQSFRYGDQFFSRSGGGEFIPRLWATRKIGYLLNQIRLHGENQEVIDQIVKLSIRYGIITPYTSYLVTEPGSTVLTDAGRTGLAADEYAKAAAATAAPASGGGAVDAAQDQSALAAAEAPAAPPAEAANIVKLVGNRTFLYADGVWIDTGFDPSRMTTTKVEFAGDDYFALIAARPELAGGFALGPNVIALAADGAAYEAISSAAPALDLPPTYTPAPEATRAADANPSSTLTPGGSTPAPTGSACPGAFLALGLVAAPFVLKRRHA
jgi:Ca-activated chloride channel family protein